jgi:hypothetical protein
MGLCLAAVALLLPVGTGRGEQFFPINQVDIMPPSLEDWYFYFLKQQMKNSPCGWEVGVMPGGLFYLPCPPEQPCGVATHRSYKGVYGIFHPGPYYIQEAQRVMMPKGWMAPAESPPVPDVPTIPQTPTLIRHIEKD